MDIAPANQRNPPPEADCKIKLDVSASDSKVVRTDIKHADDTFAGTKVKSLKNGRLRGTTRVQCKGIPEDSNVNVVRSNLISNTRVMAQRKWMLKDLINKGGDGCSNVQMPERGGGERALPPARIFLED